MVFAMFVKEVLPMLFHLNTSMPDDPITPPETPLLLISPWRRCRWFRGSCCRDRESAVVGPRGVAAAAGAVEIVARIAPGEVGAVAAHRERRAAAA